MLVDPTVRFYTAEVWLKETAEIGAIVNEVLVATGDGIVLMCRCHS